MAQPALAGGADVVQSKARPFHIPFHTADRAVPNACIQVEETPLEWRRVPCKLYDPTGAPKPLVSRLAAKGSMELRCHDLAAMAVSHGVWTNANAKPPPRTPAASAASAPAKPAHWKPRAQRERDEL